MREQLDVINEQEVSNFRVRVKIIMKSILKIIKEYDLSQSNIRSVVLNVFSFTTSKMKKLQWTDEYWKFASLIFEKSTLSSV